MPSIYRSRIDAMVAIAALGLLLSLVLAARTLLSHPSRGGWLVLLAIGPLSVSLMLWTVLGTDYTIDDDSLRVRGGPFRWTIRLQDIRSVTPSRNPVSSPALSLDRLRIDYGQDRFLLVSPKDKEAFVRDLERRRRQAARG
jgi:hypothetical protein